MKNIVIIAYEFYPTNSGGSHRPFRIAQFLKNQNYNPIVLSSLDASLREKEDTSLKKLLDDSHLDVRYLPIKPEDIFSKVSKSYYINIVDDVYRRWKLSLLKEIKSILSQQKIDAFYVTAPPFSIGNLVKDLKKITNTPVLLDMRDAWSQWNVFPYPSKLHYRLTLKKERRVLELADHVLVTSQVTIQDFQRIHPNIDESKYVYLPNSFDNYQKVGLIASSDKIKIGYVGSFYYSPISEVLRLKPWHKKKPYQWFQYTPVKEYWKYRSPFYFLKALVSLLEEDPELKERIEINFAGNTPQWLLEMIEGFGLKSIIKHHGILKKEEVIAFQMDQDYLLLTSSKREELKDYSIAGKTFEYFSLQKPILAFVTNGAQKDILEPSKLATVFNPDNLTEQMDLLREVLTNKQVLKPNLDYINQFLTANALKPLLKCID